jgi:choline dehydrogenase
MPRGRQLGRAAAFVKREVMPGNLTGAELESFVRDAAMSYWHQTCTADMAKTVCRWSTPR